MKHPNVSILIVNFNGRILLEKCLASLQKISYPKDTFEVILVDNHSTDDSVAYTKKNFPWVKVVVSKTNSGFTGGNNLALEHATGDLIVMLNNDTQVDTHWLSALVEAAHKNPNVGLFTSRLRFATPYIRLKIRTRAIQRSDVEESIDFSPIGLMIENVTCQQKKMNDLVWYGQGFYPAVHGVITTRWTKEEAYIYLPFPPSAWENKESIRYTLTFHGYPTDQPFTAPIELSFGNEKPFYKNEIKPQTVKQIPVEVTFNDIKKNQVWFIQNAGNVLLHDGYSKDRGSLIRLEASERTEFYELESEYYLQPKIIPAICGASCMVRRQVINDVGFLDGHYFMYYEDVELSVRAWKAGWDSLYVPESLVFHHHKATTSQTPKVFFLHLAERNHLFFTYTHYPITVFLQQFVLFLTRLMLNIARCTISFLREDLERYDRWKTQSMARIFALRDFAQLFTHLTKNRLFWQQKSNRSFKDLERMMY